MNAPYNMTPDELDAFGWALNQRFNSIAARHARILANYIRRIQAEPFTICLDCGAALTEHVCPPQTMGKCSREDKKNEQVT